MTVPPPIAALAPEMTLWRRDIHAHPEAAFEEVRTAALVADKLRSWGIEVTEGVGRTGLVGTLTTGEGPRIGLRADMDALKITEAAGNPHGSTVPGRAHACGHDGHVAMLLGAAKALAESRSFKGTVRFVFQPAEELEGGADAMVRDGLFERFPVDEIYAVHNWPALPEGSFAVIEGPVMAACDSFEMAVLGKGGHGAMPHLAVDPIVAGAAVVQALQTIPARLTDPLDGVVVSVTAFQAGESINAIPEKAILKGTVRSFRPEVRDATEAHLKRIAEAAAAAHGCRLTVDYKRRYPPTVNHAGPAALAARVAGELGPLVAAKPSTGAEDFSYMLERVPGCYVWLGAGREGGGPGLHNPAFDFNDRVLPLGAAFWLRLVESRLG